LSSEQRDQQSYAGVRAVVMGLGLNGGGLESARYLASRGAAVTVTDLRDERVLAPSIAQLAGLPIRYVLGRHDVADFERADLVVKNPAVPPDSPYLRAARRVETDLSLFLAACPARILAVTGSKGKSSTASALHWALSRLRSRVPDSGGNAYLGGNITVSPLAFLYRLQAGDDVVLELSSWQLGDLKGRGLLKPRVALLTAIMPDHLDRYGSMEAYVADKRLIYADQDAGDATIVGADAWGASFARETKARPLVYADTPLPAGVAGGWLSGPPGPGGPQGPGILRLASGQTAEVVGAQPLVPGIHQKRNLLAAALALADVGFAPQDIREALDKFGGIEHRLEFFYENRGIRFYNDSAATMPGAAATAWAAFE